MSSTPQTQPLVALLASHPEECAAVLCALMVAGVTKDGYTIARVATLCEMAIEAERAQVILDALVDADLVYQTGLPGNVRVYLIKGAEPSRAAIARIGAAAWLAARCGVTTSTRIAGRYDDRDAIAARVAAVLGCTPNGVSLGWRSSGLEWIGVPGAVLEAESVAALIKAGFEPSVLGWDVPGDCGGAQP